MATYISKADGNFTDAASWALIEPGTNATQSVNGGNGGATTTYTWGPAMTGTNGNVCDGVLIYCFKLNTVSTGTLTVTLSEDGGITETRSVTVNANELSLVNNAPTFFKFSSPLTLNGGSNYKLGVKASVASMVSVATSGTAGDWTRFLRLSTSAVSAPTTSDILFVVGEYTAPATYTTRTITMDNTSTTSFGAISIGPWGTLSYGVAASTNYVLRLAASLNVYENGTLNIGTSASPIPRSSTAILEFVCASAGQYGLIIDGYCNMYGQSRTSGKDVWYCKLTADVAAGTSLCNVDTDTGWLGGDTIALAATNRTATQTDRRTLASGATASTLTSTATMTYQHQGTSPIQGEVILLTRNVVVRSTSSVAANSTYIYVLSDQPVNFYWVEFYYLGANSGQKYGLTISLATGVTIQYCSFHDIHYSPMYITAGTVTARYNSFYSMTGTGGHALWLTTTTAGASVTFSNNIIMHVTSASSYAMYLSDVNGTIDNNIIAGTGGAGVYLNDTGTGTSATIGSFSGNLIHSCSTFGISVPAVVNGTISNLTVARCGSGGITFSASANLTFTNLTMFGNANAHIAGAYPYETIITDSTFYSETSYATSAAINPNSGTGGTMRFYNCDFSPVGKTAHTYDVLIPVSNPATIELNKCYLGATTEVSAASGLATSSQHDKTAGAYKSWRAGGVASRDTTFYNTAAPSERLAPSSASIKLPSGTRVAAVDSGSTLTVSVYIRKSASGDGAAYNGAQPRLIVKRNDGLGITADTVLATYSSSTGSWNQISGTTASVTDDGALEFYVDCDGTTGWINVDDWSVS